MVNKTIAAILGIAVAGIAGYELYKAYAKQQQQTGGGGAAGGAGGGGTGGGAGGGAGGTPPPTGGQEVITTDQLYYHIGDTVNWTAKNLIVGMQYTVGFMQANILFQFETFKANSSTVYGHTPITGVITPGPWLFVLIRVTDPYNPTHGIIVSSATIIILAGSGGGRGIYPFSSGPGLSYTVVSQGMQYTIVS